MKTTIINKILLVLMLITAQQVSALEFQVDGIYYRTSIFTKNSAYVTHSGTSYTESVEYQGEVVIPESVTYNGKTYTIASIGGYAFAGCPGLTSVTIPNTVTTINQNAFNGCTGLKTIECKATTPPALGDNAFTSYDATLVVPSSSESVYKSAAGWSNFKFKEESSETPGSGENSGEDSGSDNSGSDNTYGLTCNILNSTDVAIIAGSEKYTGDIVIPSQVTISGKTYTVTSIANDAFKGCTGLTSITIPSSITSIGSSSFDSCNNLNKVNISDILSWCKITFANSLANPLYYAKKLYLNGTLVTKLEIPSAITEIKNYTFYNCTSISTIVFPSGILKIGNSAFVNCSNMTSVTIPNSVTTIDENAFNGCTGLASLTIGSSVGSIGNYAFGNCTGLKSVTSLNSTPPTCGTGVFQGVTISSIPLTVPAGSESLYKATYTWQDFKYKEESENPDDDPAVDTSGLKYNIISSTDVEVVAGTEKYTGDIVIPSQTTIDGKTYNVTKIGIQAFNGCAGLTSITIPSSVYIIADESIYDCSGLKSITIPSSVTSIGNYVLGLCPNITSIKVESGNAKYDSRNNCNAIIETSTNTLIAGCKNTVIPSSVTTIGTASFYGCTGLTSITIPSSVVSLGEGAFFDCTGLTSISIPNSVTSIGENVFAYCENLKTATLSNKIKTISFSAFSGCYSLTGIEIPNSVTTIDEEAFSYCESITNITIGENVNSIGKCAFMSCNGLSRISTLNPTPPTCGENVFKNVNVSNVTLTVPTGSVSKYKSADTWKDFKYEQTDEDPSEPELPTDNSGLSYNILNSTEVEVIAGAEKYTGDIVIPSQTTIDGKVYNVTKVGNKAFYECTGLTSVTIPEGVTSIGSYAFYYCSELKSITIPNSVKSIGSGAFSGCIDLESIIVESGNIVYDSRDNCNAIIETSTNTLITGCKNTVIPDSITSIGDYAFSGRSGLTSITISNSVTRIGYWAFSGCSGLTSVTSLNPTPPACGSKVFENVTVGNITLEVPNESVSLYQSADTWKDFGTIKGISEEEPELPEDTSGLSYNIINSTDVEVIAGAEKYTGDIVIPSQTTIDGKVYNVTKVGNKAFYECTSLTSITIPDGVTSIGNYAFYYCIGLTSITIPDSVTSIGDLAFYGCSGLTSITIPNSVTSIGVFAFLDCSGLTSVTIPNSVTSIGDSAFTGCSGLTSVTIGNSVTSIGDYAFSGCIGLTSIVVESGNTVYDSRNNCNAIIETSTNTLITGCKNTVIPNGVTSIGDLAFSGCIGLTSITIPSSVTSIGRYAFEGCSGLTSISIPSSVTSIGNYAFSDCSGLTSVTSLSTTPPTCGAGVFNNVSVGNITLEVPAESVSLYQSADTWKDFGIITAVSSASRSESSGIDDILADGDEVEYYNLQGVRVMNPEKGIYIKRQGGKTSKVVL